MTIQRRDGRWVQQVTLSRPSGNGGNYCFVVNIQPKYAIKGEKCVCRDGHIWEVIEVWGVPRQLMDVVQLQSDYKDAPTGKS